MKIINTYIEDLFIIEHNTISDNRGQFVKTFHAADFSLNGLETGFCESFYSISNKNVIRGMHFQLPPNEHIKLVHLISGRICDVVLDIRRKSSTYGKFFSIELEGSSKRSLYIGKGLAHGFLSLAENSVVEYHTSSLHNPTSDFGIHFDSFGFNWNTLHPIVSLRDKNFLYFKHFESPF